MKDFITVHHEMAHVQYFLNYKRQPKVYRDGANPGNGRFVRLEFDARIQFFGKRLFIYFFSLRISRSLKRSNIVVRVGAQTFANARIDIELGGRHSPQHQLFVWIGHGQAYVSAFQLGSGLVAVGHI